MPTISASYGRVAIINGAPTPFIYGSGHGRDKTLSSHADRAAELLSEAFGLDVEKRGNSDGQSVGAHYDGRYGVGLGARRRKDGRIVFEALFEGRVRDAKTILAEVPNRGGYHLDLESRAYSKSLGEKVLKVSCYSPAFATLDKAFTWLQKYGVRSCPTLAPKKR